MLILYDTHKQKVQKKLINTINENYKTFNQM